MVDHLSIVRALRFRYAAPPVDPVSYGTGRDLELKAAGMGPTVRSSAHRRWTAGYVRRSGEQYHYGDVI